jgi:hypothetical protein
MSGITRRDLLKRSAQTTAGLAAAGALSPSGLIAAAVAAPPTLSAKAGSLATVKQLTQWNHYLADLGPRHTGNAAQKQYINDLDAAMKALGWETDRQTQTFSHWEATDFDLKFLSGGKHVHPAIKPAYYYPYSGETPVGGVTGELKYANKGATADFSAGGFAGTIAVVEATISQATNEQLYKPWFGFPAGTVPNEPYARSWIATVPSLAAAKTAGCIGVIVILPMAPTDAKGQYIPFKKALQGMPSLHVDALAGKQVRALSQASGNSATLSLPATVNTAETTDGLLAVLPGANTEEVVVVNTHTDGPDLIEENGGLGLVSVAQHLAGLSIAERPSTVAMYFATGHFAVGVESAAQYVKGYPELFKKTKAGVTFEHLGCLRWKDNGENEYGPTGGPESSAVYSSKEQVAKIAEAALQGAGVSLSAAYKAPFSGEGAALNAAGIPMMSYIAGPDYLLQEARPGVQHKRFDVNRMKIEIDALSAMIDNAAAATPELLKS